MELGRFEFTSTVNAKVGDSHLGTPRWCDGHPRATSSRDAPRWASHLLLGPLPQQELTALEPVWMGAAGMGGGL